MAPDHRRIDESIFASEVELQGWCDRIGDAGLRGTASAAHEDIIAWVEDELGRIPGVTVRSEPFEVLRWRPHPEGDLEHAAELWVVGDDPDDAVRVPVGGAVPYSRPTVDRGQLVRLAPGEPITAANAHGQVVLRDFPHLPFPYDYFLAHALHVTPDCLSLQGETFDRPGLADELLHQDLLAAGHAGAAGVVFTFDLPREQIAGYFEPHKGTHYAVPAVFVGIEERERLRTLVGSGPVVVELAVHADVGPAQTRNVTATLAGRSSERIILVTHTDGNTWIQENGIAALLALATYFAALPVAQRPRTIEFAFTSAHLHISREGSASYAARLNHDYDDGTIAFAFAIEHLGARELIPVERPGQAGRRLQFTDAGEPLLWAAGPSEVLRRAVIDAVISRGLDRTLIAPGLGIAVEGQVPRIASFGGLGTYFHTNLIPTTSIITGPWSLWAPAFGRDAVDIARLRQQVLAAGDVVLRLDGLPREAIAGDYLAHRRARAAGAPTALDREPPEVAAGRPDGSATAR
jgi:hypothetical protein